MNEPFSSSTLLFLPPQKAISSVTILDFRKRLTAHTKSSNDGIKMITRFVAVILPPCMHELPSTAQSAERPLIHFFCSIYHLPFVLSQIDSRCFLCQIHPDQLVGLSSRPDMKFTKNLACFFNMFGCVTWPRGINCYHSF